MFKHLRLSLVLLSLAYIVLGGILVGYPGGTLRTLCMLVGGVIALYGARLIYRYVRIPDRFILRHLSLVAGIICIAVGAFLALQPNLIIGAVPVIFGLFIIFDSLVRLTDALQLRNAGGGSLSMIVLVLFSVALGAMMIYNPFGTAETMMMAIGIVLIVEGVMNLCTTGYVQVRLLNWRKTHPEVLEGEDGKEAIEGEAPAVDVEYHDVAAEPVAPAFTPADETPAPDIQPEAPAEKAE